MRNMWLSSKEEVLQQLSAYGIEIDNLFTAKHSKSKSEYYTQLMLEQWYKQIEENSYEDFTIHMVAKNNIITIVEHFKTIIQKRGIAQKLIKIFDNRISEIKGIQGEEVFMAEIFALLINAIVYDFDMQFLSGEERQEIKQMVADKPQSFFGKERPIDDATIAALFDNSKMDVNTVALEKYNRWIELLRISLLVNSGFVTYDEVENNVLKELLRQYQALTILN